jgi:mannose-6-phosphate isomerase-like protein (cupin superfamily)
VRCRKEIVETDEEKFETNVAHHVAPGEGGKSLWVLGELVTYKITSYQTGGAYSLFEVVTQPGGGPPAHVQHREDEAFYILEGEYEFLVEGRTISAGAGSLVYVPKGNLHTHKSVGEESGTMLVSQTPGGLHERFFKEVGERATAKACPVSQGAADIGKIAAIATEYGIEIPLTPDQ